jgi:hypothetical protein
MDFVKFVDRHTPSSRMVDVTDSERCGAMLRQASSMDVRVPIESRVPAETTSMSGPVVHEVQRPASTSKSRRLEHV